MGASVSHQQVPHHFDLLVDMVEDLSAALGALLDPLLLCQVVWAGGATEKDTDVRKTESEQKPSITSACKNAEICRNTGKYRRSMMWSRTGAMNLQVLHPNTT